MAGNDDINATVRARLRSLRLALGWSLDDVAARAHLSASTISRIETGKRTISLDVLAPLCRALQVDVNALLDTTEDDEDVVIRPLPTTAPGRTTWPLSRPTGSTFAAKVRIEPGAPTDDVRIHPGHDWFFVLSGRILLTLGERQIVVSEGEAAEFSTMTPHVMTAIDEPAEVLTLFDSEGQRAHLGGFT